MAVAALLAGGVDRAEAEILTGLTIDNRLVVFDSNAPNVILKTLAITGNQPGEFLLGIDRRPDGGQLFALGASNRLYTIDDTGAVFAVATPVGSSGAFSLSGTEFGFDFNPTVDRIRVVSNADQNLRLNPDGSLTATDTNLAYDNTTADGDPIDPNAGANPSVVGSAYTNNDINPGTGTTLYGIDSVLDILIIQNPPNAGVLNTVGSLGFNTSDLVGFDIFTTETGANIAFASLTTPAGNVSQLFSIDLATGAATNLGSILAGAPLRSLVVPEPASLTLLGLGVLGVVTIARRRGRLA